MKLCLEIALYALLGSVAIEGFGSRPNHRRRGSSHGRELFQIENLGRNGPRGPYGPYAKHGHTRYYRRHHYRLADLKRQQYYSEESSESDYESNSELDDNDSSEYSDWYKPGRRPCWGWRCSPRGPNAPWSRPSTTKKPILSSSHHDSPEPAKSVPALTVSPNTKFMMSRRAPIEEVSLSFTTAVTVASEINPTTMASPETTTVSQAILDCIEDCISTPEFNPVCGSNDETYGNIGKLFCAKSCGIDVELRRMSRCWPQLPFPDDYDDYDANNNNSGERDSAGGSNISNEGSGDEGDYGGGDGSSDGVSDSGGEPPLQPFSEKAPQLSSDLSLLRDIEQPALPEGDQSNIERIDPSSSLDVKPSPSTGIEPLLFDDEISPPPRGDVIANDTTVNFLFSSTTNMPRFRRTTHLTDLQNCMKLCPVTTSYYPICGTDYVTYINIDRIECARGCGLEVQILCEQPCHVCKDGKQTLSSTVTSSMTTSSVTRSATTTAPETLSIATSRNVESSSPTMLLEQCIKSCPIPAEYNPVCGTDNVNYTNPVHLLCVQMCGDDVKIARFGSCSPDTRIETLMQQNQTITTPEKEKEVTLSPEVIECINRCVVTSEYNPVCGTNEETYTNPGRLECAKFCGIDVELNYKGLCNGFFFSEFTSKPSGDRPASLANQATASWEILRPASSTKLPLRTSALTSEQTKSTTPTITESTKSSIPSVLPLIYSSDTSSVSSDDPTASTAISTTTKSPNSHNFTLAPDVLNSIFGNPSAIKSTTDSLTTKEDEFNIDPRYDYKHDKDVDGKEKLDPNRIVFPD